MMILGIYKNLIHTDALFFLNCVWTSGIVFLQHGEPTVEDEDDEDESDEDDDDYDDKDDEGENC